MNRRGVIALLAGAALARPFAAQAQQKRVPVVGLLSPTTPDMSAPYDAAFRQGLADVGYVEGQTVVIEYRYAENHYDRLPALAADLVARKVDVIATTGPLRHWRRKAQPRRCRSSSKSGATRSRWALSPASPDPAAI